MKKTIYLFAMVAAVVLASCNRDERDLFDKSASERLHALTDAVNNNLLSAPNGWELRYFPTEEAAGYVYLLRFEKNGSVLVAAKNKVGTNNAYKEETGLWTMDGTQGAILSLNSYIDIFSVFADPGTDGVGLSGDYEFVVLENTPSKMRLKGKKHGAYMEMYPLAADQNWQDYFKQVDRFNELVFSGNDGIDMTYAAADTTLQLIYEEGQFKYEGDGVENMLGFVLTPTGLHFYSGCPLKNGGKARDFRVNDELTQLVATDAEAVITANYSATDFFAKKFENKARWILNKENTDAATLAAIKEVEDLAKANGAIIARLGYEQYLTTSNNRTTKSYNLYVGYTVNNVFKEGSIKLNYTNKDNKVTFSFKASDASLAALLARIDVDATVAAKKLAAPLCGSFAASSYTGSTLNMTQMVLEDGAKKLHVVADNELY